MDQAHRATGCDASTPPNPLMVRSRALARRLEPSGTSALRANNRPPTPTAIALRALAVDPPRQRTGGWTRCTVVPRALRKIICNRPAARRRKCDALILLDQYQPRRAAPGRGWSMGFSG